jgi:transcription elongation factor GreA
MIQPCPTATPALTPAGRASLQREIQTLRRERLPALTAQLAEAQEDPAVRDEDAALLELQPEHSRLERPATEIERLRAVAREIVPVTDGVVALGSRVEIHDAGKRDVFQLIASCETNIGGGRRSIVSPLGRALLGHANKEMVRTGHGSPRLPAHMWGVCVADG